MSLRAIDVAYDTLLEEKAGLSFKALWAHVREVLGYDDKMALRKQSQFYTDLSLDGRFIGLEGNVWNLKIHCKYDDVAVKEEEYEDIDDQDDEEEELEENEYVEPSDEDGEMNEY